MRFQRNNNLFLVKLNEHEQFQILFLDKGNNDIFNLSMDKLQSFI